MLVKPLQQCASDPPIVRRKDLDTKAIVVHALHKSASMFLYRLFEDLSQRAEIDFYSIHSHAPGQRSIAPETATSFVLCPVRSFDLSNYRFANIAKVQHLVQVRDPRDILVSQYFSLGWIHSDANWSEDDKNRRKQIRELTVDQYVLGEAEISKVPLIDRYRQILPYIHSPECQLVRYEEMVLRFGTWLGKVTRLFDFRFPWLLNYRLRRRYAGEFVVSAESMQHRRRVIPGDYLDKLQPETIRQLNRQYADLLNALDYPA